MSNEMAQDASLLQDFLTECDELLEQLIRTWSRSSRTQAIPSF